MTPTDEQISMTNIPELVHSLRPCPVCGHAEREVLYRQRFAEFSSEGLLAGYDVVVCRHCGLCFGDRIPNQEVFDRYYAVMSKYEAPQGAPDERDPRWQRLHEVVPFVERAVHRDESILEIGCASGQLLHLLGARGFSRLRGIDPSPNCARVAREHYGLTVDVGTFSSLNADTLSADLIILIGVLEHMRDLGQALGVVRDFLPAGGRVFVSVPDASHYLDGVDAPFQEFSVEHINFFGPASLTNLMRAHGFDLLFCESVKEHSNATTITPVIQAAFTKRDSHSMPPFVRDEHTEGAVRAYVAKSQHEHQAVVPILQDLAASGQPLVVWGAGAHTLRLLAQSPLSSANILSIIDSNPRYQGKRIGKLPIVGPAQPPASDAAILVSSRVYQDEISRQIRSRLQWRNRVITLY